ncbi:hypothetical protein ACJMK2_007441 [Sinanodonta woodiana]|uniref:Peptidase M12B domain-containing protein n=1 Tax=Sinanodonta woodiana TaxID=1069815 RepID=A0ABD3VJN2_SINWO
MKTIQDNAFLFYTSKDKQFLSLVSWLLQGTARVTKAEKNVKRYFSYIMNGVDQLYSGINDPNIAVNVKICGFFICKLQKEFAHRFSQVHYVNGYSLINASTYLDDLFNMDVARAFRRIPEYDQVILFTRHTMYVTDTSRQVAGISYPGGICVPGYRVEIVHLTDYFKTTSTAAHELGHSLGAVHDGDDTARGCKAEDGFIMTPRMEDFVPYKTYSSNPWKFSTCSVEAFKRTIVRKPDLTKKPVYTQSEIDEWNKFMSRLPGQKYSPSMQCQFILGLGSSNCGVCTKSMCQCAQDVCSVIQPF